MKRSTQSSNRVKLRFKYDLYHENFSKNCKTKEIYIKKSSKLHLDGPGRKLDFVIFVNKKNKKLIYISD